MHIGMRVAYPIGAMTDLTQFKRGIADFWVKKFSKVGGEMRRFLFYIFSALYLFLVFGSIYGLFVSELTIGLSSIPYFHFSLIGWVKNIVCLLGLLLSGLISAYPILLALYRAMSIKY